MLLFAFIRYTTLGTQYLLQKYFEHNQCQFLFLLQVMFQLLLNYQNHLFSYKNSIFFWWEHFFPSTWFSAIVRCLRTVKYVCQFLIYLFVQLFFFKLSINGESLLMHLSKRIFSALSSANWSRG